MLKKCCLAVAGILITANVMSQNMVVKGKITDVDTVMVLLRGMEHCDTVMTTDGSFYFSLPLKSPELFTIVMVKERQSIDAIKEGNERKMRSRDDVASREFFMSGGEMVIQSSFAGIAETTMTLSNPSSQETYREFLKRFRPLVQVARAIIDSSYVPGKTAEEKKLCGTLLQRVVQIEDEVAEKFVIENKQNAVGAYVLYRYCRIENRNRLDSLYKLFSASLQATAYLKNIKTKIDALSGLAIGKPLTDFTAVTMDGKPLQLVALAGKYTVLDFWGSWCQPCIGGFPKMKEYHQRYHDKINFIGIACNDEDSKWRSAVKKYGLDWIQVLNETGNNDLAMKYNVEAYPTKILIDDKGRLVEIFVGESENFYRKLDALFKQ